MQRQERLSLLALLALLPLGQSLGIASGASAPAPTGTVDQLADQHQLWHVGSVRMVGVRACAWPRCTCRRVVLVWAATERVAVLCHHADNGHGQPEDDQVPIAERQLKGRGLQGLYHVVLQDRGHGQKVAVAKVAQTCTWGDTTPCR